MKPKKHLFTCSLLIGLTAGITAAQAEEKPVKPYPLKTCIVSGEPIDDKGEMKPHTFVVDGQEVKLCCKSCLIDFNKGKAGYLKKIDTEVGKPRVTFAD